MVKFVCYSLFHWRTIFSNKLFTLLCDQLDPGEKRLTLVMSLGKCHQNMKKDTLLLAEEEIKEEDVLTQE